MRRMQRVGIWITPDTCTLFSSFKPPMFGASAFTLSSSRISQPTDAQWTVPTASNDDRNDQAEIGCALSSHSIMTRGRALVRITLREALVIGDFEPFIRQTEADGLGAADGEEFETRLGRLIKEPPQVGQTSRSPGRGGSRET